jgi:hypothetical protein
VTPEWLTAALRSSGVPRVGRIVAVRWERVGQDCGFTGVVGRVQARYEHAQCSSLSSLIFDRSRAERPVVLLDWQTVAVGPPASAFVGFVFGSLGADDRRAAETELCDRYVTLLARHGVGGYSVGQLRRDCTCALLLRLAGTVVWRTAGPRTPRRRPLRRADRDGAAISAVRRRRAAGARGRTGGRGDRLRALRRRRAAAPAACRGRAARVAGARPASADLAARGEDVSAFDGWPPT